MFSMEVKGLDKFSEALDKMEDAVKELKSTNSIPFSELFTSSFMKSYTNFASFDDMLSKFGYEVNTNKDFEDISKDELDKKISKTTQFKSWQEMLNKSFEDYCIKKLSL